MVRLQTLRGSLIIGQTYKASSKHIEVNKLGNISIIIKHTETRKRKIQVNISRQLRSILSKPKRKKG